MTLASVPLVLAGLMGAAGVALAAMAAHGKPGAGLDSASQMLLIHALAVIGASALARGDGLWKHAATLAVWLWLLGAAIFAGDIALRAFAGARLFPMAAPIGGSLLIAAWLVFAIAAVTGRR